MRNYPTFAGIVPPVKPFVSKAGFFQILLIPRNVRPENVAEFETKTTFPAFHLFNLGIETARTLINSGSQHQSFS